MAEKQSIKERLQEITASIEKGIAEVFTSGKYADYLRTMSRFHHYSTNNQILIHAQNPKATLLCGFRGWETKFGRHVVKGAKGIKILAPTPFKKVVEEEKLDPDTKLLMLDKDGNVITEEKEIKIPMFKPVTVFDVADTDGKPLPVLAETLVGDVQNYEVFMEALRRSSPVPILFDAMNVGTDGYFSLTEQNIHLREGMSEIQTVCAAVHEITHAKLHNRDAEEQKTHRVEEIEAEAVAYSVSAYYGIETDANSFGYLANYTQGKSIAELKASLDLIGRTAHELITDIDRHYADIMAEREMEEMFMAMPKEPDYLYLLDNRQYLHLHRLDEGFSYTLYDAATKTQLQSGQYDKPDEHVDVALMEILDKLDLNPKTIDDAHIDELNVLQAMYFDDPERPYRYYITPEALEQRTYPVVSGDVRVYETTTPQLYEDGAVTAYGFIDYPVALTEQQETEYKLIPANDTLYQLLVDKGNAEKEAATNVETTPEIILEPLPDPLVPVDVMHRYGYTDADMLPISKDRALELVERDVTLYMLYSDNSEAMVFDRSDIEDFDGLFGITREEWDAVKDTIPPRDVEQRFMNNPVDAMAVYQLKEDAPVELRFTGLERLDSPPDKANYTAIYTRDLVPDDNTTRILENFYYIFNEDRPADFTSHSLSVSDIIALKQEGVVSYYYCDSIGFKELPDFGKENTVKAVEKKPSVLEKLKEQPEKPKKAKTPKKTKGQEL